MWYTKDFEDYELLDCSDGERLERWGDIILVRPDPQVIWKNAKKHPVWKKYNARYIRSSKGGGAWDIKNLSGDELNVGWNIQRKGLTFCVRPTGFKHTGVFPEQASNWDFIDSKIRSAGRPISVLNLFGYTGIATIAAANAGASVCHVDASKGIVAWCKENAALSGLSDAPIRYIVDDCKKFIEREIRRGHKYDAIIMDPPSYGRGPGGEIWKLEDDVDSLIALTSELISENPLFVIINSYTTGLSASTVGYIAKLHYADKFGGKVESDEIGIPVTTTGAVLPAGSSTRWEM
ncbi:MAG: class I SAM-dependent methyltransferase [Clostridia bacterium]|nr:class I SAM-dependent methyltransferase [Clostridia bacterium]